MIETFDFIIVGGGTAGCLIAQKLASTPSQPKVALFEAGERPGSDSLRRTFDRFSLASSHPELSYDSKSTPQPQFGGREIDMIRGKGLGGGSQINFQVWSLGAKDEFDAWAKTIDAPEWGFESIVANVKKIENAAVDVPVGWEKFVRHDPVSHGFSGSVDVSIGPNVEPEARYILEAAAETGYPLNLDPNDGDPIGFGLALHSTKNGFRITSESAFLRQGLPNLRIHQGTVVSKIIFENKKAVGVQCNSIQYFASKEVILAAGAIGSPQLLLHSGVGSSSELQQLGIEVVQDLPGIGKSFSDHPCLPMVYHMGHNFSERVIFSSDPVKVSAAEESLKKSMAGPLTQYMSSGVMAFLQLSDLKDLEEFSQLSPESRELLLKQTTPHFELAIMGPLIPPTYSFEDKKDGYLTMFVTLMNPQSKGTVSISSADPAEPPVIDPNYLQNPFDRAVLIKATREALKVMDAPSLQQFTKRPIVAPTSTSDENIEKFIHAVGMGLFHPSCTVKMGPIDDSMSCVNRHLKVHGLHNLRVADLSVTPLLPSGHTQIVAYIIGNIAFEKIAAEWSL